MRKCIFLLSIFLFFLAADSFSKASDIGVPLGKSPLYDQLQLKSGDLLKEMVVLPEYKFDQVEASKIVKRLDLLPRAILSKANQQHIKIILFDGSLTDIESASHLKGKVPRGYPETVLWDDLPGVGGSQHVLVKIGCSEKGSGHGSVNLEYHELAHSLQRFVYNGERAEVQITRSWEKEAASLFPGKDYFMHYKEEFFAESFAYFFYSAQTRAELKKSAPVMYEYLSGLS
ncbi:anthrax toxin lethal factor-related metalloendopeptidase [Siminovitchia sp. 179-K 8D1 HS]|uniref:anthrax toxin lethal factor-related metalloendopeptidase n=1 Tax=Siminovitchia sp. 179-K 8D1 HS TaxID=3142385 RepID=UPI00399FE7F0